MVSRQNCTFIEIGPHPSTYDVKIGQGEAKTSSTSHEGCTSVLFFSIMNILSKGLHQAMVEASNYYTFQYKLYEIYAHCCMDGVPSQ